MRRHRLRAKGARDRTACACLVLAVSGAACLSAKGGAPSEAAPPDAAADAVGSVAEDEGGASFDAAEATPADGGDGGDVDAAPAYAWQLPPGFPVPAVPPTNPMSAEKVELGRRLFYDVNLSHNLSQSCASCHKQELAFTDGRAHGVGSTGMVHPRGAMSLANVAYASTLTWANPLQLDLEHQALVPIFGDDPVELGLPSADELVQRLAADARYPSLFAAAWPADPAPMTLEHVVHALASFERTLVSGDSPFDRWLYGRDPKALSDSARRGYQLFSDERVGCTHCHVGFAFTDHVNWAGKAFFEKPYHNTGLYNIDGKGAYPEPNTGVYHVTGTPRDMGHFKAPTLRNIAVTAPYMHDGSIATLAEALDHYQAGGRTIVGGPYAGDGNLNPLKDPVIRLFTLSDADRADLIAFLGSLTDDAFLHDPRFAPP
jgi:cytochrome c peroxidase